MIRLDKIGNAPFPPSLEAPRAVAMTRHNTSTLRKAPTMRPSASGDVPSAVAQEIAADALCRKLPQAAREAGRGIITGLLERCAELERRSQTMSLRLSRSELEKARILRTANTGGRKLESSRYERKALRDRTKELEAAVARSQGNVLRQDTMLAKHRRRQLALAQVLEVLAKDRSCNGGGCGSGGGGGGSGNGLASGSVGTLQRAATAGGTSTSLESSSLALQPSHRRTVHHALVLMARENAELSRLLALQEEMADTASRRLFQAHAELADCRSLLEGTYATRKGSGGGGGGGGGGNRPAEMARQMSRMALIPRQKSTREVSGRERQAGRAPRDDEIDPNNMVLRLQALEELLRALGAAASADELVAVVLSRRARRLFACQQIAVYFKVPDAAGGHTLHLRHALASQWAILPGLSNCGDGGSSNGGSGSNSGGFRGLAEAVLARGEAINAARAGAHPAFSKDVEAMAATREVDGTLLLPVAASGGSLCGVLQLVGGASGDARVFDAADEALAHVVASQFGASLQRLEVIHDTEVRDGMLEKVLSASSKLLEGVFSIGSDAATTDSVRLARVLEDVAIFSLRAMAARVFVVEPQGSRLWHVRQELNTALQMVPVKRYSNMRSGLAGLAARSGTATFCLRPGDEPSYNEEVDAAGAAMPLATLPMHSYADGGVFAVLQVVVKISGDHVAGASSCASARDGSFEGASATHPALAAAAGKRGHSVLLLEEAPKMLASDVAAPFFHLLRAAKVAEKGTTANGGWERSSLQRAGGPGGSTLAGQGSSATAAAAAAAAPVAAATAPAAAGNGETQAADAADSVAE